MGFITRLFGSENLVQAAVDTGDALVYTKEERAKGFERLLQLYEPFKIAQRFLALIVGIPYVTIHLICVIIWLFNMLLIESNEQYILMTDRLVAVMTAHNEALFTPFCVIVGFYFFGGAGEGIARAVTAKK